MEQQRNTIGCIEHFKGNIEKLLVMKTRIITSFISILFVFAANAQTKYYQKGNTYQSGNTVLKTTINEKTRNIILSDVNARFLDVPMAARDGGFMSDDMEMGRVAALSSPPETFTRANNIITESLSSQSKRLTKGRALVVRLVFNPDTGKVWEVWFGFDLDSPFTYVTPEEYAVMMTKFKNEISVTITPEGRGLNYIPCTWIYDSE